MILEKLAVRTTIKKRKPTFTRRQGIRQFSKLKKSGWRAPKGMGNKQRRGRKGQPIKPSCGFGSPKLVHGLDKNGFKEIIISNIYDLEKIDSKTQIVVISSRVGAKKKLEILKIAKNKNLSISNIKDLDKMIKVLTKTKKVKGNKKSEKIEKNLDVKTHQKTSDKKSEIKENVEKKEEAKK